MASVARVDGRRAGLHLSGAAYYRYPEYLDVVAPPLAVPEPIEVAAKDRLVSEVGMQLVAPSSWSCAIAKHPVLEELQEARARHAGGRLLPPNQSGLWDGPASGWGIGTLSRSRASRVRGASEASHWAWASLKAS